MHSQIHWSFDHEYMQDDHLTLIITTLESGLASQLFIPLKLCVLFLYMSGGNYSLNWTSNIGFLRNLKKSFFNKSAERMSPPKF